MISAKARASFASGDVVHVDDRDPKELPAPAALSIVSRHYEAENASAPAPAAMRGESGVGVRRESEVALLLRESALSSSPDDAGLQPPPATSDASRPLIASSGT